MNGKDDMALDSGQERGEKQPRRGCAGAFFCLVVIMGALAGSGLGAFVWLLEEAQGKLHVVDDFRPRVGSKVYSSDGELLAEFTSEGRRLVRLSEMPLHLQKAFIATEDTRFYEHRGVRLDAIANAALYIIRTGSLRGGSTITQQFVRSIDPDFVSREQTVMRKVQEALISLQVERWYTKDEILELYLNQIFLGISAHGVEAASQQYFAKSCRDLTLGESAMLAGLARLPNRQEPFSNFDNALARRNIVLGQMLREGLITRREYEDAIAEDLAESVVRPEQRAALVDQGRQIWLAAEAKAPYFVRDVRLFILRDLGAEQDDVFAGGLEVHTTLDWRLQQAAEEVLLTRLEEFDEERRAYLERRDRLDEFMPVSGALVLIDNRPGQQGMIRAMVGGRDFASERFNIASQARRQPGSSVKPFVWAAALDNGFTASSILIDEPYERIDGAGNVWAPKNFDGEFRGPTTLREALEQSVNIISIKLMEHVGMPLVRSYMQRAGIRSPIDDVYVRTLALGAADVTILEQAAAYATFPNGGIYHEPYYLTEIRDRDGVTKYVGGGESREAFSPQLSYLVTYLLEGAAERGTGRRTARLGRPRAGKTGTSNDSRNVWFCGYTPDFTAVVWLGYRDNRPLGRGLPYTGGALASPVWTDFMIKVYEVMDLPVREFEPPHGVVFYNVDRETGVLGGTFREAFLAGTTPPRELPVTDVGGETLALPVSEMLEAL